MIWVAPLLAGLLVDDALLLRQQVVRVEGVVRRVLAEDLDRDGRRDLLVFSVAGEGRGKRRRRVSWFAQRAGGFPAAPDRSWDFDPQGAVVDLGRSREGVFSLYYTAPEGIRRYRLVAGQAGAPRAEPYWAGAGLLWGRSEEAFQFVDFVRDWLGQGAETPAVPQPGRLLVLREEPGTPPIEVRLASELELFEIGAPLEFRPLLPLFLNHTFPSLTLADWNGDGKADLIAAVNERVEVHLAREASGFTPDASFETRLPIAVSKEDSEPHPSVQLDDLTGDGQVDALVSTVSGGFTSLKNVTQLFRGIPGGGFESVPRASLESRGAFAQTVLSELDGDGHKELALVSVPLGISALLKLLITRRVSVRFSVYRPSPVEGRMVVPPLLEWSLPLALDFSAPGGEFPVFTLSGDFNGDGLKDLVSAPGAEGVTIRALKRSAGRLEVGRVLARLHTSGRGQALAVDLGGRGTSDLVLYRTVAAGRGEVRVFLNETGRR